MAVTPGSQPTERFTGLAEIYARCRPSYPVAAIDAILSRTNLRPGSVLVDVGSGTGISSRVFAARGLSVIGIEPNADMRQQAEAALADLPGPKPVYRAGQAEATGLPEAKADAVLAAQAFHWFEPAAALTEFHRIVRPGGWVILMWNERDPSDPFTAAYGALIRSAPEAAAIEVPRGRAGEVLFTSPLFEGAERQVFVNSQELDLDALLGRAFSASYAPHSGEAAQLFAAALQEVFECFERNGRVVLHYETSVYLAHRPALTSAAATPTAL